MEAACPLCGKELPTKCALEMHMKNHTIINFHIKFMSYHSFFRFLIAGIICFMCYFRVSIAIVSSLFSIPLLCSDIIESFTFSVLISTASIIKDRVSRLPL